MDPMTLPIILYYVVMGLALLGWCALIFFPRRPWANFWFAGLIVPLLLSFIYMYLLLTYWFLPPRGYFLEFLTLPGVQRMFQNYGLLLVAWINLTAMDLFAGAWMTRKAVQTRMPIPYLIPCLILTFVFVGFGFTAFAIVAAIGGAWKEIAEVERVLPRESAPVDVSVPSEPMVRMS